MNEELINELAGDEVVDEEVAEPEAKVDETSAKVDEPEAKVDEPEAKADEAKADDPAEPKQAPDEVKAEGDAKHDKPEHVPVSVLQAERRRRQESEQRLIEAQARLAAQEQLRQELEAWRQGQQQNTEEKLPDYDEDPLAHLKAKTEQQEAFIQQQTQQQAQQQQQASAQQQQQQAIRQVVTTISQHEQEFVKEADDYYEAVEYMRGIQRQNLTSLGMPPDQAEQEIARAELATGVAALEGGVNPASYVYDMAVRTGYTRKQSTDKDASPASGDETMDAMEKGVKAQSAQGGGTPNLKDLADVGESEFDEVMKEMFS